MLPADSTGDQEGQPLQEARAHSLEQSAESGSTSSAAEQAPRKRQRGDGQKLSAQEQAKAKAARERQRRDRLNSSFSELRGHLAPGSVAESAEKPVIIAEAIRELKQLRAQNAHLRQLTRQLQERAVRRDAVTEELALQRQQRLQPMPQMLHYLPDDLAPLPLGHERHAYAHNHLPIQASPFPSPDGGPAPFAHSSTSSSSIFAPRDAREGGRPPRFHEDTPSALPQDGLDLDYDLDLLHDPDKMGWLPGDGDMLDPTMQDLLHGSLPA